MMLTVERLNVNIFHMLRIAKIAVGVSFLLLSVSAAYPDVYKYTDENGVTCYTDAPFVTKSERVFRQAEEKKETVKDDSSAEDYSSYVQSVASKYEIEPELIHAVIKTESNGNHRAVSRKGAMGLMQLMPSTANDMNVGNPFNPAENIEGGTKYLKSLIEKFNGDLTLALAAYNAGPKTVEKYNSVPPISETKQYVKKVFSIYKGKRSFDVTETVKDVLPKQIPIYKVVLGDGTILFTNSPFAKAGRARF
jgi:Transglycosylase SLT domain/Domain of unknown function (DUF4124)